MLIEKIAIGVLGIGAAGFIGRGVARHLREKELDAMEEEYKRMVTRRSDPDIVNALNELRSLDFSKLKP